MTLQQLFPWFRRKRRPLPYRRGVCRIRPRVESLEDRLAPAVYTVNNLGDAGQGNAATRTGDLRWCISQATSGSDTINIRVMGAINLNSALTITNSVTIDGPGADSLTLLRTPNNPNSFRDVVVQGGATSTV